MEGGGGQATDCSIMQRVRTACWIPKATDTHTEHVILIAFQRHQWLRERPSLLRHSLLPALYCLQSRAGHSTGELVSANEGM